MKRRAWVVAALVFVMAGCGNERNGYHASETFPTRGETTVTMGRPGDHWVNTMQFVRVARTQHGNRYGYEVAYETPGGTTFTLFWSRDQIDLRGVQPGYRLETMPLDGERFLYPNKLTQESLPNVFRAIELIESGHARDADGVITAAEMFGIVAALGGVAPALRPPGTGAPAPRSVPSARASAPGGMRQAGASQASGVLFRTPRRLQKFFTKHGADFGLRGNWSPARAADASRAIHQHINSPGVRALQGTYRGKPVTHYLDPNTGLNIIADPAGNFVSGWRLSAEQLQSVLVSGRLF